MDMRFSKMVRDREESQLASDGGEPQVCGDLGRGFDDADGDPSLQYVAYEQHRCGLLMRFLQDSVRTPSLLYDLKRGARPICDTASKGS
jgi:hypothetical protein